MIFVRQASHHFKAQEVKDLRPFDFFQLVHKNMFNGTLAIIFIDISWRCLTP